MTAMRRSRPTGLVLEPLTAAHAEAMFALLSEPRSIATSTRRRRPTSRTCAPGTPGWRPATSADGRQHWLNWVVRLPGQPPLGYVQATVLDNGSAWVAYLLGSAHQGRGHATRATAAMLAHLESEYGATRLLANVEAENLPSIRLLQRLGFRAATAEEAARHEPTASERIFVRDRLASVPTRPRRRPAAS